MNGRQVLRVGATAIGLAIAGAGTALAAGDKALSDKHVALAQAAAGEDLKKALTNCRKIGGPYVIPADKINPLLKKLMGLGGPNPMRIFDNLVFLGTKWVTAWALVTSDGIILIDALNNDQEAKDFIEGGLKTLGLDPAQIRKIIVTHAHGDHYGGARYLAGKYGAEVIMSETDWKELDRPVLQYDDKEFWGRPPARGTSVNDGDVVTLGDTSVKIVVTPGHTPGTISPVFPLKDGGSSHKALLWGGTGLNFGPKADRFVSMIEAAGRFAAMAPKDGIDVVLSNHSGVDDAYSKGRLLATRKAGEAHPFVTNPEKVGRFMTTIGHCVSAQLATFAPEKVPGN